MEDTHARFQDLFVGAVTVGERGQVVIPAEARQRCAMQPGDKLLVFIDPATHGVTMTKVDQMHLLHRLLSAMLDRLGALETEEEAGPPESDTG